MAENGLFGTPFLAPKNPPEKVYVGLFLRAFPGNKAHKLFSRGPKWGVLSGGQKVYVEKVYVLFRPLEKSSGKFEQLLIFLRAAARVDGLGGTQVFRCEVLVASRGVGRGPESSRKILCGAPDPSCRAFSLHPLQKSENQKFQP